MNRWGSCGVVAALVGGAALSAQSVTTRLGITEGRAREAVFDSFVSGTVSLAGNAGVFTAASPAGRVAMVTAATTFARAFVESDEFARRYADHREANGPEPLPPPVTADEVLVKQRRAFEEQVEGIRQQYADVTAAQQETLEKGFEAIRARFAEMEAAGARADLEATLKGQRARQTDAYQAAIAALDAAYPPDPRIFVARHLRRFLDLAATVDFTAELVEVDGRRRFRNPDFEAQPASWKLLFRAGKPAAEAARTAAARWLADLGDGA